MPIVRAGALVVLDPADARDLWLDTRRWATFVDGFGSVHRVEDDWPAEGGRLVWQSTPNGRGRVIETVTTLRAGEVVADVEEERLRAVQTARFRMTPQGTEVSVAFEYRLKDGNVLVDLLFIRRALRDALRRTVARYAREADAQAELVTPPAR